MVRETRHLWVGNLPENIREDRIKEHFKRYGRVQSVKLLPRCTEEKTGEVTMACTVAFMDIKSASKAHNAELKIDDRTLNTEYYEPAAIPSSASLSASIAGGVVAGVAGVATVIGSSSTTSSSPSQNAPSPYSTSPAGARFPNGHGPAADDHASFTTSSSSDRFSYDRSRTSTSAALTSSVVPGDVGGGSDFRRGGAVGYHDAASAGSTSRSAAGRNRGERDRDRSYRTTNGPSSTYLDGGSVVRSSRTTATGGGNSGAGNAPSSTGTTSSWSSYESNRYNSTGGSQTDTGYCTTPSENDRRNTEQSAKKKTTNKSRSGSRSVSPSGSASSRSPSRSRSRSSSSSSTSSTSRATSSTGSPKSRRLTSSSSSNINSNHQPIVHSDDRRPLAICVRNLPLRSSDTSLKDGLFHEYKKHGKVTWVKVVGQNSERHAIVCFKKPEDVEKALEVSYDKCFFGCKIEVAPYQGYDVEDNDLRPYEAEIDEYHPKATRTLFIGNLEKDVTASDLRKHFDQFGEIIEIDIKKQGAVSSYAFCQYSDIVSVVKAIRKMDGEHLGNNRIKLGFGKSMPYNCVWIDGINEHVNEKYLRIHFDTFGVISKVHIDRDKGQALIFYEQVLSAQAAVNKMRGFMLKNSKLQVDFASRECQESFFERLEKQGGILERNSVFDERRETSSRSFESSSIGRFSRYDVPSRPRTSSYSSRSGITSGAVVSSSIQSPGGVTPGSVTPRGAGSRSSRSRFIMSDYYDPAMDYPSDRHLRSYDEYSQGSAASHDDVVVYEHEYTFVHDSPTHLDLLDSRSMQSIVVDPVPFAPGDIRNLQKERVHLLEQLEECPSSSDELMSPKKRLKLDLLDGGADVIIEANRDHRKVMEVRRLSDANLKHHSRRPSIDSSSKHSTRDIRHDVNYVPHAVCKRRKTAGSDSGSRVHHYDHSGSESVGGSRPGTPLCDERPENLQPSEPRRVVSREREGPLTLPLPRFASQVMNRGSVSVAGIKGQKDNVLSSPPAVTSPRITNPRPPSPVHVPPPASPPPRPPSISSNSSDSDVTPPSPSLEERIRSLDEKYEKWSGSRTQPTPATGDAILEKFRQRHKILDLDLKEVQPSEIVKSVMAKRSVFDEDLKRLENVGEKYEPKEFSLFPRVGSCTTLPSQQQQQTTVPAAPLSAPPTLKLAPITQLPKTPTMLSPRSAGTPLPAAKGLQYPFPTHPPVLMSPIPTLSSQTPSTPTTPSASSSVSLPPAATSSLAIVAAAPAAPMTITTVATISSPTVMTSSLTTSAATTVTRGIAASHGDNRLKPCASASSDTRTTSKVTVNRSNIVSSNKLPDKTVTSVTSGDRVTPSSEKSANKTVRETKSSDKTSEKISSRRNSNGNSPRADIKTRRNSDTSARRIEDTETPNKEKEQCEERKKERFEKIKHENEKLEKEKQEKERIERERLEKEKQDKEKLEREKMEKDRLERESELERQRLEKERLEREKKEKEEKARLEKEQAEREEREKREREERERKEREKREREEKERREREQQERERREREERERREREEHERKEREEKERREREEKERREREEKERKMEEERLEKERQEKEKHFERERERSRHKEDNHDKRTDHKHRETHSETKTKDNSSIEKHSHDSKNIKDDKLGRESHSSHDKSSKHHTDKEDRKKESVKENRDNNTHDKQKGLETRHMSIDLDKNKSILDTNKRKERNNSVPANIGSKRRLSSHEMMEPSESEAKRMKISHEHKKVSERRDSRDSTRSEDRVRSSSKHKNNSSKSHDKHNNAKEYDEKRKEKDKEREERHKKHKLEKQKSKSKSREKEQQQQQQENLPKSPVVSDKEFLSRLDLKTPEDAEKHKKDKEQSKHKSKEPQSEEKEAKFENKKDKIEKQTSVEKTSKSRSDNDSGTKSGEEKKSKRDRVRKITNSSESDSDEPKKHSIFDIVDDEPAYISMYDKVKARSCKNMAKQEEEKRQEKIKAKFSQLKQSRAKREEKKRSTSWDEDSESEKESSEVKHKRCPKLMLIDSSDEDNHERKSMKKKDFSDSDSSAILRRVKQEPMDTSEDEIKNKHLVKGNKLRTQEEEDEYNKKKKSNYASELKTELLSDENIDDTIDDKTHLTKIKEEMETLLNKERRNSKQLDATTDAQIYAAIEEIKQEKLNNRHNFIDNTSDEESHELTKKERKEKKHKKKQKKQKHSLSTEDLSKLESLDSIQSEGGEKSKHHEKKKEHSKKEKRRDKTKEGREKSKKSKKNKSESKNESKKEVKMENIFGSLSDDSESCTKDVVEQEPKLSIPTFDPEDTQQHNASYVSENEKDQHEPRVKEKTDREKDREEHKRKKEKKRREKERRLQEAAAAAIAAASATVIEQTSNENSMDFADMGKQLEENMLRDDNMEAVEQITKDDKTFDTQEDPFRFIDVPEKSKDKDEKRDGKEKKKKRKKSKDEKGKHHHHHHHDKNKSKSSESKKEHVTIPQEEIKEEVEQPKSQDPSLPVLMDELIKPERKSPEPVVTPQIPKEPVVEEKPVMEVTSPKNTTKSLILGFDDNLSESAVQSISEFVEKPPTPLPKAEEDIKIEETTEIDEKPRVVISQEETEDAVAALLGESFTNAGQFEECYEEDINVSNDQSSALADETNPQDDEEMRQAVQSLSAADLDIKPETPQSETELQIDTDTEEQDDTPSLRYDGPPKTPDIEVSRSKTPDSTYYQSTPESKPSLSLPVTPATPTPLIIKPPSSPPSLTPIKSISSAAVADVTKVLDMESKSLPHLPENTRSVITQPWPEKKPEVVITAKEPDTKPAPILTDTQSKIIAASPLRVFTSQPVLKIAEPTVYPPLQPISKSESASLSPIIDHAKVPVLQPSTTPNVSQMHNLPARPPVQITSKPSTSVHDIQQSKLASPLLHNRLPITSVMVSKPLQPTTVILQQSKIAHSLEPPKLVSTSDPRPQERPRMVFQAAAIQTPQFAAGFGSNPPRMMVQGSIRHLTPQGLLVPTRQLNPHSFGYLGNVPHSTYNISPVIKDNVPISLAGDKKLVESQVKVAQPSVTPAQNSPLQSIAKQSPTLIGITPPLSLCQPLTLPKPQSPKPSTPCIPSPPINPSSPKISLPSPKPSTSPLVSPVPKSVLPPSPLQLHPCGTPPVSSPLPSPKPISLSAPTVTKEEIKPPSSSADSVIEVAKDLKQLDVPIQERTSITSPVITSTIKEELPKTEDEMKKPIEEPVKLAIQTVTEELNMSLDKEIRETVDLKEEVIDIKEEVVNPESTDLPNAKEEPLELKPSIVEIKLEEAKETMSINKEIERFEEEKADTESVISDISKECLSADILAKDDPLDTKEDSDYWSAKEVNIDSVIKTLCSADELSDHSSENGKDDWDTSSVKNDNLLVLPEPMETKEETPEKKEEKGEEAVNPTKSEESEVMPEESTETEEETKEISTGRVNIRGRGRGRARGKTRGVVERGGIQTRRGKLASAPAAPTPALPPTPTKRGRITKPKPERKTSKSESETSPADIYEFRDETDDSSKEQRPRLILTIKSPAICSSNNAQTTATVKEVTKDGAKEIGKEAVIKTTIETKEFVSPAATNKRKSKRLQEKDIRNTVDDTIEDVVKNTITTRASANQRRSTRQTTPKLQSPQSETPRKSPRGRKTRRGSEATETSSSEEASREEITKPAESPVKDDQTIKKEPEPDVKVQEPPKEKEKPLEGLKAAFLRRIKGEQAAAAAAAANNSTVPPQHEPTNLIDPVTGEIIPMRECEEGKYIPLPGSKAPEEPLKETPPVSQETKPLEVPKTQPSVITQPQPITIVQHCKPQTLKAHVLSSQAAQAAQLSTINPVQPPTVQAKLTVQPVQVTAIKNNAPVAVISPSPIQTGTLITPISTAKSITPVVISKSITPIVASKVTTTIVASKVTTPIVSKPLTPISQHLSVNTSIGTSGMSSPHLSPRTSVPLTVVTEPLTAKQIVKPPVLSPVQTLNQQKQALKSKQFAINNTRIIINQAQVINNRMAHMKQQQPQPLPKQQIIIGKAPHIKQNHPLHPQQVHTAGVPSPPISKSQSPMSNAPRIIQGPTPVGPKGIMEPPKVDVSMANIMLGQRPKLSPQGPHQRLIGQAGMPVPSYEASLGEAIPHFPPGPIRPPPDLSPAHYIHPSHVMQYQQYLRQQQLHLTRSGGTEKVGDGQEGEEAPVTSPPLELRRPGSVGMPLAGRGAAVPHSLHSPHDRATDSPQVGQVYNVHSDRMPYYTANRFFDHAEPPPAHQQINSHAPLAALGSDRSRAAHITPIGVTPDRPLSGGHPALSAHMGSIASTPERSAVGSLAPPDRASLGALGTADRASLGALGTPDRASLGALGTPDRPSLGGLGTPDRPISSHIERPLSLSSTHGMMGAGLGAAGNLMGAVARHIGADAPTSQRGLQAATPPHASQVPPQAESLLIMLMRQYPCMWQGLLALKNDQAAVQMYFVSGNDMVAKCSLPKNTDGSTPPLRIFQRMRLEPPQVEGVARKMQMENEHCILVALPCGYDHMDVLKQSTNLTHGFITYLQQKQAAGIVNVAAPGTTQPPAYVVHIFPSCDFVNDNLKRIAPSLLERVADIPHLLIVITTV